MKKTVQFFCLLILLGSGSSLWAQDVRASSYESIPLLMNPANTGNFEGTARVTAYEAFINSDKGNNTFTNLSADMSFGPLQDWAVGINYFHSGNDDFQVTNNALALSIGRRFVFGESENNSIRLGAQLAYNEGKLDETRGQYYEYSDVGILEVPSAAGRPVGVSPQVTSNSYVNFGIGAAYKYENKDISFETGVSLNNLGHPQSSASPEFGEYEKRFRLAIQNSFGYDVTELTTLRFNYLMWQERVYGLVYNPDNVDDNAPLVDNIFGVAVDHTVDAGILSFELAERSQKTVIGNLGFETNSRIRFNLAYELPINKDYYDVAHFELGLRILLGE
jgi:hypothetical protein